MIRYSRFSLRTLSVSSVVWFLAVPLGWGLVVVAAVETAGTPRIELAPAFAMIAALAILLELLPLVQGRGHDPQGVVMSTAFVCATMFVWGPWPAILMVAIGSVATDIRARKQWWKIFFNPAQYALSVFAAHLVVAAAEQTWTLASPLDRFHVDDLLWMFGAWVVYFCVNNGLVAGVLTWNGRFWENFGDDFWHNALMTFAVLALSPLVLVVGVGYWPLMPLLLIPLLLLYYTAALGLEREYAAGHDALTGLPNRATLQFELEDAFATHAREDEPFALMLIDLNDFKRVNDTLGHQVGDVLLVQFAQRLQECVRPTDLVARLGGDEFAVIVFDVDEAAALDVATRIRASIGEYLEIGSLKLEVDLSLGIALCPAHGVDGTTLLRRADVAMYLAKERTSGVEVYSPDRDENSADRLELLGELREALTGGDLQLYYQPKVAAGDFRPLGVEALLRWRHPVRGFIPPDKFIPLAERSGVMPLLTARVVEMALAQAVCWRSAGLNLSIAVNISPSDLDDDTLADMIADRLQFYDLDPSMVLLEITERRATQEIAQATRTIDRLRALGVRISLDDFGTGYSSLSRLSTLPVDEIKIDRIFVSALSHSESAASIIRALIDLAHALRLPVIAEGVETLEEWRQLAALGCDGIQGWHVAKPMPAGEATDWINAQLAVAPLYPAPVLVQAGRESPPARRQTETAV